jgi:hypothetical protein
MRLASLADRVKSPCADAEKFFLEAEALGVKASNLVCLSNTWSSPYDYYFWFWFS